MRTRSRILSGAFCALTLCLSSRGFLPAAQPAHVRTLTLPAARPAVLIVITNPDSTAAMRETASLIAATARTGERVVILGDHTGLTLATSTAPAPPSIRVTAPSAPLPQHPTSFQKARITDTLTNVLFGLGQYRLSTAALPQLRRLLRLLTVQYPNASATIIGYTDGLPTPGGNLRLSRLRAQAVVGWLIAQGVESDRLQAFGYGDADPVAPNTPTGQPLDRRVEVIIDPTSP